MCLHKTPPFLIDGFVNGNNQILAVDRCSISTCSARNPAILDLIADGVLIVDLCDGCGILLYDSACVCPALAITGVQIVIVGIISHKSPGILRMIGKCTACQSDRDTLLHRDEVPTAPQCRAS